MIKEFNEIYKLIEQKEYHQAKLLLNEMNNIDIAESMAEISIETATAAFNLLTKDNAADVFSNLEPDIREHLVNLATDAQLRAIVNDMYIDDAVDMLQELPANMVKKVLKNSDQENRDIINKFLNYPENSTGSIMTAEFIDFKKHYTVSQALKRVRKLSYDSVDLYTYFVVDENRKMEGVLNMRTLLQAKDDDIVADLMEDDIIFAKTSDDQEATARTMIKYDLTAMPVTDTEDRLVGIVTIDDVFDVISEEITEDFEKMAAIVPSEKPYLKTSALKLAGNRIVWLVLLLITSMLSSTVLSMNESVFAAFPLLVAFIPMLADAGGNAGSQSSTTIIRSMTLGELELKDGIKVMLKELWVGLIAGSVLGLLNYLRFMIFSPGETTVALVTSLALLCTIVFAKTVGGLLPMIAKSIKLDPALMSAPLISTIVDTVCLMIYFKIAKIFLHIV